MASAFLYDSTKIGEIKHLLHQSKGWHSWYNLSQGSGIIFFGAEAEERKEGDQMEYFRQDSRVPGLATPACGPGCGWSPACGRRASWHSGYGVFGDIARV